MKTGYIWGMAVAQLKKNIAKTLLTVLGIVIGIAAVISVLSVGNAGQEKIEEELEAIGMNKLCFYPDENNGSTLTLSDSEYLKEHFQSEAVVSTSMLWDAPVSKDGRSFYCEIVGVDSGYEQTDNVTVSYGGFLDEKDIGYSTKSIVLSYECADTLFGSSDVIGETVEVGGAEYEVIGVQENSESLITMMSPPKCYIPITTMQNRIGNNFASCISVMSSETENALEIEEEAKDIMYELKGNGEIRILSMTEQIKSAREILKTFKLVLGAIAAVSLIVGGIGIMNMLLSSVRERTYEIGLRMAIGASKKDIMKQFLCESLLYSAAGAAMGIVAGAIFTAVAAEFINIKAYIYAESIIIAVAFAVAVGFLFGIIPAYNASKLNPVEALRRD